MLTLVTGATGLVGNNVVRRLLAEGRAVRVLARDSSNPRPLEGLDVQIARGDVRDRAAVSQAIRGAGSVIHSAGHVHIGWSGMANAQSVNVEGARNVAEAACAQGIRMVHVSSVDALGLGSAAQAADEESAPEGGVLCPYVVTKREAELVVLEWAARGLDVRIVNPGFMLGPNDWKPSSGRMLLQVARGRALFAPVGANTFCDVRDVASGILVALARGRAGRRYVLAGETMSYFRAWRIFAEVTGGTPPIFPAGPLLRRVAGFCGDTFARITGREGDVNSAATAMAGQWRNYSSARAAAELDYRTRPLCETATDAWQWFCQHGFVR